MAALPSRFPAALRHPAFVRLWAGSIVSSVGTQMSNVAKLWVLYGLTHSAAALGLDGLCFSVPIAVLPLVAGPVTDRVARALVVKVAMAGEVLEAAGLAAAAAGRVLHPWMIYLAAGLAAARLAFDIPARGALTTGVVSREALLSAQSLSAAVWNSAALVGPAVAGVLLASTGATAVFVVNGSSTLVALLLVLGLRPPAQVARGARSRVSWWDGLRFARRSAEVASALGILLATGTLVIGTETLLPVLDETRWHGGPVGYGLLRLAPGVAAVLAGAAIAAARPRRDGLPAPSGWRALDRMRWAIGGGLLGGCLALAGFAVAPGLTWAIGLLVVAAAALNAAQIRATTRIQQVTPDRLRGAVGGFTAIVQSGLAGTAAAGMAAAAAVLGAPATVVGVALVSAVAAPAAALRAAGRRAVSARATTHGDRG